MKILLVGDYSNVHATLGAGLRKLGHKVTVASDGDGWKNYPRDIDLRRHSMGKLYSLQYLWHLEKLFRQLRGYDVVQLIGPDFLPLKAERILHFYNMLRKNNGSVFLGAFGMDRYYIEACLDCKTFRYSDFNFNQQIRHSKENDRFIADWLKGAKGQVNEYIAKDCNGIIAGLYEYHAAYQKIFSQKLTFIPFPIVPDHETKVKDTLAKGRSIRFFIGLMRDRMVYKGTDIMLKALLRAQERYGDKMTIQQVENVPFAQYQQMLLESDVLLDQLYSYTPAMNALEAMAHGIVVVGGGEPENYAILREENLRPIVNVEPNEEHVYQALCTLIEKSHDIPELQRQSKEYICRHHDYLKVAQQYVNYWSSHL